MPYTYKHPHPSVTADAVVFGLRDGELNVLLIQRRSPPYESCWALPGGFVEIDEDLGDAVQRELQEETGITGIVFEQLGAFGAPKRDPRERVISVAYFGLTNIANHAARESSDAKAVEWFLVKKLPRLAFDHQEILQAALRRLRQKARLGPIGLGILPKKFSLAEIQGLYEAILERKINGKFFRRNLLRSETVAAARGPTHHSKAKGKVHLYRFDRTAYRHAMSAGIGLGPF
jgi:8-oxo-dGTP diphosphatase